MSYIGQGLPADTFQGFTTDSFTGDGSATTFTLSKEPFSEDTLIVVINNVIQKPTTNFTVSGTTLTIVGTAVASGDVIYAIHMGGPLPIGGAAELDLNGASDKLILDADGDTTISADTDDQIDIKIAGADDFQFTANTFTAQSGSTITTPTLGVGNTKDLGDGIHIKVSDTGASTNTGFDELVIEKDGNCGISILSGNDDGGAIIFGDDGDNDIGNIFYNHDGNYMAFNVNAAERIRIDSSGLVGMGASNPGSFNASGNNLVIGAGSGNEGLTIYTGTTGTAHILFADGTSGAAAYHGYISYAQNTGDLNFYTGGGGHRFQIQDDGTLLGSDTSIGALSSDQRLKKDIVDYTYDITKFKQYKPRNYAWKYPDAHVGQSTTGFVAQEVETVDDSWVSENPFQEDALETPPNLAEEKALCDGGNQKTVKLGKKDAMYISVIQQLITRIEALEDA